MNNKKLLAIVGVLLLAVIFLLAANQGIFRSSDGDNLDEERVSLFKQWDSNGDRVLDVQEFDTGMGNVQEAIVRRQKLKAAAKVRKQRFTEYDTDGNGSLSEDEYHAIPIIKRAKVVPLFSKVDANNDNQVDLKEFFALRLVKQSSAQDTPE